jgi:hypothetical protein
MKILMILIPLFISHLVWADRSIPAGQEQEAFLGLGYDSEKESLSGACLRGQKVYRGQQTANVSFEQSLDERSMQRELGIDAGTRFRYGEATVKASAKFLKASRSNGFTITAVYSGDYKFKNEILVFDDEDKDLSFEELENNRLTIEGRAARRDDDRWRNTCGDEYVAQIVRGAKLFYSIKIEFSSQDEKDLFESTFKYKSTFASVSAHLKNVSQNFNRRTKVTVGALQIGGDVRKITELFYDNSETNSDSSLGFVQCSFGDLSQCDQVMANAIRYATKDFKEQLESQPDNGAYEGGPAYLRYITKPYAFAGIYPNFSSILNASVRAKRRELENFFDRDIKYLNAVSALLSSQTVVLSPRQFQVLNQEKNLLDKNIQDLIFAAETCYRSIPDCIEVANPVIAGLHSFDPQSTIIHAETFRQFCSRSDSALATPSLRQSIEGMIRAARDLDPNSFSADPEGDSDICLQAHSVFARHSEVPQFAKQNITTLEPLREYNHFTMVDFSDNEIEQLDPIRDWVNLEQLVLRNNRVRNLAPLGHMLQLTHIDVANNRLRELSGLASLPRLQRVDARNNHDSVQCQELSPAIVCLSATLRTDAQFVYSSTNSVRPAFMPSIASTGPGRFFVVSDNQDLQTYDISDNRFSITGRMSQASRGRVATALADGDILITGGWESGRSLSVYNPDSEQVRLEFNGLKVSRVGHTSTLLPDGRVLITGGWENGFTFSGTNATMTAEIFDPSTNSTRTVANMHAPRAWHTATLLPSGQVLLTGGFGWATSLATAEIFDPATNRFTQLQNSMGRGRGAHTATLLDNGKVLIAGGFGLDAKAQEVAELFDPQRNQFETIREPMGVSRAMHAAVKLNNGKVLLAGGSQIPFTPDHPVDYTPREHVDQGELYDPIENSFLNVPTKMAVPRARHQLIETQPGTVLVIGGSTWESSNQLEVFNYVDVNASPSMN